MDDCFVERRPENYLESTVPFDEFSYSYSIACDGTRTRKQAIEYEYRFAEYEYERRGAHDLSRGNVDELLVLAAKGVVNEGEVFYHGSIGSKSDARTSLEQTTIALTM